MSISKKRQEELKVIGGKLLAYDSEGFDDVVSLCEAVSRGVVSHEIAAEELTIDEGSFVYDYMDELAEKRSKLDAITIIDCGNASEFDVNGVQSFHANKNGEFFAKSLFYQWAKEAGDEQDPPSDETLQAAWDSGRYEIGQGFIGVVRS